MKFSSEYNWLRYYIENDSLYLEDSLNWDESFDLVLGDYNAFAFLTTSAFVNMHVFLDSVTKNSFLDLLLSSEAELVDSSSELFDCVLWDVSASLNAVSMFLSFLFFTEYQDFGALLLQHAPELVLAWGDYVNAYHSAASTTSTPLAVFDTINDSMWISTSEFNDYLVLTFLYMWLAVFAIGTFRLKAWKNSAEVYLTRLYTYIFCSSVENRIQTESAWMVFFFAVFYMPLALASFDDDQEEFVEFMNGLFLAFFAWTFLYFLMAYSLHSLAFLEASVVEGRSVAFIALQFRKDFLNVFAFVLRFGTLMFRLNVYDTIDDFQDSYYIFIGDFDEDEYFSDLFFSTYATMFFDTDAKDDRSFLLEDEMDLPGDLFSIYFVTWGKFAYFLFFIIDEIARVTLALFLVYLIVFEVHAVNRTFIETQHLINVRAGFEAPRVNKL